jgi:PAS domain S-box-containing protein
MSQPQPISPGVPYTGERRRSSDHKVTALPAELLRRALQIDTVGVLFFNLDGRITDANDAFLRMSGYDRGDLEAGRVRWDELTPPEWMPVSLRAVDEFKRIGKTSPYEKEYIRKDGSRWWGLFAAKRVADGVGVEFVLDLTERKAMEQALRESEAQYRLLFDSIDQGFCVVEVAFGGDGRAIDYRFIEVNAAFAQQTGLADAEGRWMRELNPQHETHWFEAYGRVALTGEPARFENRADGLGGRWFEVYAFRVGNPAQRRVAILFRDITARKHDEDMRIRADRQKDEFIATLSHELRNPLASIASAARVLESPKVDAAARGWAAQVVQRQSRAMARLLDDLLDVSRLTLGRLTMQRQHVALATIFESALEATRPLIDAANHTLSITMPPASLTVDADPLRMSQVISNLLANAAKYTDAGGHIALGVSVLPKQVAITVTDTGIGIEPSALEKVFELFSQEHDAHERAGDGLGIGLALVRGIVTLHGGRVEAASEGRGRGSRFTVTLPRAPDAVSAPGVTRGEPVDGDGARYRVLIADDNVDAASTLAVLLGTFGHETHVASTGAEALRCAEKLRPHLAVLDIGMPDVNGYEVARRIRAAPWGRAMALFAATGWGQDKDKRLASEAGFDEHLTKPVDIDRLNALVLEHAARARA